MPATTTPAVQDYLKALCHIEWETGESLATTTSLASRLGVSAASATNMLKKLDSMGLVILEPYHGAELTVAGRKIALEVIRHHRLLETYLAEALGVPWDKVHDEAEVLEHVLSEGLEDRIAALLGDPEFDPHGHPIPSKDGSMRDVARGRLWDAKDGAHVVVDRVSDEQPGALRYLDAIGLRPGTKLEVAGRGPVDGPLFVRTEDLPDDTHALSRELAEAIWVE
jgi:DtxR family Mn-dependent transcriptional regulator